MALNLDLVLFLVFHGSLPYLNEAKKTIGEIIGNSTMGPGIDAQSVTDRSNHLIAAIDPSLRILATVPDGAK